MQKCRNATSTCCKIIIFKLGISVVIFLTGAVAEGWGGVAVQLEGRRSLARYGRTGMRAKSKHKNID